MRECGKCNLCCTVLDIPEINKVRGVQCPHSTAGAGCTIYDSRPKACVDFECAWLQGEMSDDMIPNEQHVMIEKLPDVPVVLAMVEPDHYHILKDLKPKLADYTNKGIAVVACNGMAIIPEGVTPDDIKGHVKKAARKMGFL